MIKRFKIFLKLFSDLPLKKKSIINNFYFHRKFSISVNTLEPPWRVLFFGTDEFSLESLKMLCSKLRTGTTMSSLGVVTKKGSVVFKYGLNEKLSLHDWPVDLSEIRKLYDVGMVVSFGNLIPKKVIDELPLGCINVHASLLPRWRGAAPIIHAIMAGDTVTGVTIMRIHPHKFDVGEIVRQYKVPIQWDENAIHLEKKLAFHGSQLLLECLRDLKNSLSMAVPQPPYGITYAPKLKADIARVDWAVADAKFVFNLHRAFSHLHLLKTTFHGIVVRLKAVSLDSVTSRKLLQSSRPESGIDLQKSAIDFLNSSNDGLSVKKKILNSIDCGKCTYDKGSKLLRIVCADGQCVIVEALQVGNKHLTPVDFYNGYLSKRKQSDWTFK